MTLNEDAIADERAKLERAVADLAAPAGDPVGTVRVAPTGTAVAVCIQQPHGNEWLVVDAYGPWDTLPNEQANEWPVVYSPDQEHK